MDMIIHELHYSNTNTYLIEGKKGKLVETCMRSFQISSGLLTKAATAAGSAKTGADKTFIQDVMRMYLTHQNIGVQGILDRIEIKNR